MRISTATLRSYTIVALAVLMTLDLGKLREAITAAGHAPQLQISKEWLAALQAVLIFLACVYRFYTNEGRTNPDDVPDKSTRWRMWTGQVRTMLLSWVSFLGACGIFSFIMWALLNDVGGDDTDVIAYQVLVYVWIGYPLVSIVARACHWGQPNNEYLADVSVAKDIAYAFLDVTSKSGLALYWILRSSW